MNFIPVNTPLLDGNEKKYINECLDSGWISSEGPFVTRFEEAMAQQVGRRYGIAVSSGTAALDIAVAALRLGPGDEVIAPTLTIISCLNQLVRCGATPVLVDADPQTWNMTTEQVAAKITSRTRAIIVVHLYGLPVDMGPLLDLAAQHGLAIIEDAAEMHGQTWRERPCGSFGTLSVFSFYPNKHITTGEGGMVLTDDPDLAERCRELRNLCFQRTGRRFVHEELGWNYRMTNLQAALGVAQLENLSSHVTKKRAIGQYYNQHLQDVEELQLPLSRTDYADNIYWIYGLVLNDALSFDAAEMERRLNKRGIGTRPFFWPMHEQPVLQKLELFHGEQYPVAERLARRGFYIPSGLGLSEADQAQVVSALKEVLA